MASSGRVQHWHDDDGWGVIECQETPGGCWFHYGDVMTDRRPLEVGQEVRLRFESADQDGYRFRATEVWPADQDGPSYDHVTTVTGPSAGFSSTLRFRFGRRPRE